MGFDSADINFQSAVLHLLFSVQDEIVKECYSQVVSFLA